MHGLKQAFNHRILLVFLAETEFHNQHFQSGKAASTQNVATLPDETVVLLSSAALLSNP
jgi:hypothetical protein